MNITIPNKLSGDTFEATEFNIIKDAINSKADQSDLTSGLLSKVDKTTYATDLASLNDSNSQIRANLTTLNNAPSINLTSFLTITGATLTYQPKGSYLVQSDITNKFLPVGTSLFSGSYLDLTNKPNIPNLTGYATETFVTSQGYATQSFVNAKGYLTAVSWSDVSGKPSFFNGDYTSLTNQPTIPSITGLASTIYVDNSFIAATGATTATINTAFNANKIFFGTGFTGLGTSASPLNPIAGTSNSTGSTTVDFSAIRGGYPNSMQTLYNLIVANQGAIADLQANGGGTGTTTGSTTLNRPVITFGTSTATANIVNWTSSTNATSYTLDRSSDGTTFTNIYTGSLLTFNDTGRTALTLYYYRLKASGAGFTDSQYATANKSTADAGSTAGEFTDLAIDAASSYNSFIRSGNNFSATDGGSGAVFALKAVVGSTATVRGSFPDKYISLLLAGGKTNPGNASTGFAALQGDGNKPITIYNGAYGGNSTNQSTVFSAEHRLLMVSGVWTLQTWVSADNFVTSTKINEIAAGSTDLYIKIYYSAGGALNNVKYSGFVAG